MFGSTILDVAIGLIFAFLTVSLAVGSLIEAGSALLAWRAKMLLSGVTSLVNDPKLVALLYDHALVNPRNPGAGGANESRKNPAYINPANFASALLDVTQLSEALAKAAAVPPGTPAPNVAALQNAIALPSRNPQIEDLLKGVIARTMGDPDKIKAELAQWFDTGMDRLSGVYKRWTQLLSFVIAFGFAVVFNVNAIEIGRALWTQPVIAEKLKIDQKIDFDAAERQLAAAIPIGWPDARLWADGADGATAFSYGALALAVIGWLITALSSLFGAPFWFDALQSVVRLKGAGPSPGEKAKGQAASV
jgi:hypothetical protein